MVELLGYLRRRGITRVESTPKAGEAWTAHLAVIADATQFGRTDSWYMGANIPGKRRQLLNYPFSDDYLDRLQRCAVGGYEGFVLG